ncbi:hypothetical protein BSNK01_26390 [Bacillaceae bacterium]
MKFIDELFAYYRDRLTGDEEDAAAIVLGILAEQEREDLFRLFHSMDDQELFDMAGLYMLEMLREKMAQEGIGETNMKTGPNVPRVH